MAAQNLHIRKLLTKDSLLHLIKQIITVVKGVEKKLQRELNENELHQVCTLIPNCSPRIVKVYQEIIKLKKQDVTVTDDFFEIELQKIHQEDFDERQKVRELEAKLSDEKEKEMRQKAEAVDLSSVPRHQAIQVQVKDVVILQSMYENLVLPQEYLYQSNLIFCKLMQDQFLEFIKEFQKTNKNMLQIKNEESKDALKLFENCKDILTNYIKIFQNLKDQIDQPEKEQAEIDNQFTSLRVEKKELENSLASLDEIIEGIDFSSHLMSVKSNIAMLAEHGVSLGEDFETRLKELENEYNSLEEEGQKTAIESAHQLKTDEIERVNAKKQEALGILRQCEDLFPWRLESIQTQMLGVQNLIKSERWGVQKNEEALSGVRERLTRYKTMQTGDPFFIPPPELVDIHKILAIMLPQLINKKLEYIAYLEEELMKIKQILEEFSSFQQQQLKVIRQLVQEITTAKFDGQDVTEETKRIADARAEGNESAENQGVIFAPQNQAQAQIQAQNHDAGKEDFRIVTPGTRRS